MRGAGTPPARTVVTRTGMAGPLREALVSMAEIRRVSVADLVELRCAMESAALAGAAAHPLRPRLREAVRELAVMSRPGVGVEEFEAADVRFHIALARASGNEALHLVMVAVRDAVAHHLLQALRAIDNPRPTLSELAAEHAAILEAVQRGDGADAARLVREHITGFYLRSPARATRSRRGAR